MDHVTILRWLLAIYPKYRIYDQDTLPKEYGTTDLGRNGRKDLAQMQQMLNDLGS